MATAISEPQAPPPDRGMFIRRFDNDPDRLMQRQVPAFAISGAFHVVAALIIAWAAWYFEPKRVQTKVEDTIVEVADNRPEEKQNLHNEDAGLDPSKQT